MFSSRLPEGNVSNILKVKAHWLLRKMYHITEASRYDTSYSKGGNQKGAFCIIGPLIKINVKKRTKILTSERL